METCKGIYIPSRPKEAKNMSFDLLLLYILEAYTVQSVINDRHALNDH